MIALVAAVVVSSPAQQLKDVADRVHETVIAVRGTATIGTLTVPTFGSGVLIGDGLALTTLHTVSGGNDAAVIVDGGAPMPAKVVGGFPKIDLAVIRVENAGALASATLAEEAPAVGEPLLAMGTDEESVTAVGVNVAAINGDLLVFASTRPVDSRFWGGPVFDARGRLVAVGVPTLALPGAMTAAALRNMLRQALVTAH